ncbi:TlpA family protein disulfide reductase [Rhodobium gokarnense]|uniref:Peroxiredoxin n=1 Tax=Rhodobium gokarnense TaxID=364296 RepID=A0ABT3HGR3_9HYPH|nr:TlpA disulfide reductase family protein [Rhodobium gokarnense]MCW2309583.1 peroxiredoxin [Rhodobium gokarnense]
MTLLRFCAVILASAFLIACEPEATVEVGKAAPDLTVMDLDGQPVKLSEMRGKVVFVNFWWSGCGPCLAEMPEIDRVYRRYRDEGLEVLAVNIGQDAETIRNTNRRLGVAYPLVSDELKISTKHYGVAFAPTSFLIDRKGVVRERINGPVTQETLTQKVAGIL